MSGQRDRNIIWANKSMLWYYIKPYTGLQLETFLCMLVTTLLRLPGPFIIKMLIDKVFIGGKFQYLGLAIWGLIILNVVRSLFSLLENYLFTYLTQRVLADFRTDIFSHVLSLKFDFFNKSKMGNVMTRLTQDIWVIAETVSSTVLRFLIDILTTIFIMIILLTVNWQLTLISLITLPVFGILFTIFNKYVKKVSKELREKHAEMNGFLQEILNNVYFVKSFDLNKYMVRKYYGENSEIIRSSIKNNVVKNLVQTVNGLVLSVGPIMILLFGSYYIKNGILTIGTLMMFYLLIGKLYGPLRRLINMNVKIQTALASFERVLEYLQLEPEEIARVDQINSGSLRGEIEFQNVTFAYNESDGPVLKNISFKIKPGEKVGIVGESGGGKTTILNLLFGFYESSSGQILIDGLPIQKYSKTYLRDQLGFVSQDTFLFNMSIKENLKMADRKATNQALNDATNSANIHDFIVNLPNQYNQLVGEKGINLSGGQKQRISIARMLLKKCSIAILDEATSALDFKSENYISQKLLNVLDQKTVLVVGHRFSMINHLDRVFVMKDGRIVEEGNPQQLLIKGGYYALMYNDQYREVPGGGVS